MNDHGRFWLALRMVRGVGPVMFHSLLRAFDSPRAVFAASAAALARAGVCPDLVRAVRAFDDWGRVDEQTKRLQRCGGRLLTWADATYPERLRHIHDPPPFLFVYGELQACDRLAIALVGSRRASAHGVRMARELSRGLVPYGVTVVSGLARGVDAEAHWAALRAGGRTVAVLGSGIDVVYPSEHHALFRAIGRKGAVVSELFMGTQPDAENFPGRNRIISGMTLGTVVVEAAERSGSLITAGLAGEQGREVFAVPGAVGAGTRGTHRLLRDGAKLTERAEDVLEEIAPQLLRRPTIAGDTNLEATERAVLKALGGEATHVDDVIARSALAAAVVLPALLGLELKGVVQQLPGKVFVPMLDLGRRATQDS
jgi:DNA processing protein